MSGIMLNVVGGSFATIPGAPTIGTATATGSTTSTVSYTAPINNGGSVITSYTATSNPGGITGTLNQAESGTITVNGLTAETSYTFTVTATNAIGTSVSSSASNSITTLSLYWIGLFGSPASDIGRGNTVDSLKNSYLIGRSNNGGGAIRTQLVKYNSSGVEQWQRRLGGSSNDEGYAISTDSSNNVYILASSVFNFAVTYLIAKYDTSGVLQWQQRFASGQIQNDNPSDIIVDSSGNVYVCGGNASAGGQNYMEIAKFNTSGVLQWQRQLGTGPGDSAVAESIAIDPSGNIYICGNSANVGLILAKYNNSGVIQWQRRFGAIDTDGFGVAADSSGNAYIIGYNLEGGSNYYIQLAKYNTSGVLQWQRRLGTPNTFGQSIAVDSSNNVYVCGNNNNDYLIAKYNTSGVIQWQRKLISALGEYPYSITVDSSSDVYINGTYDNSTFLFAKLPGDGSKTGVYTVNGISFTYATSSLTDQASSLTEAASTLPDQASSFVNQTASLTSSVSTLTSSVTIL